ncbi:uncharacterized protein Z520_00028 [Fonsecaea multimorphosa CBS 102226]|uniref:SRR1-like domain-containing protein n=1 Tax=Fonsecaea multimorphosa CBS 102226 TaxID=1442371 RepID=A0A0D2J1T4_9EURO|nr:uncharacterized protein Z520_00028 [Fonsecaea multimorphosa CBS 102226]KIY03337.1 hypothetical protein Z520_00028 [Fonsecaea multimorphosa CBS 102226]OAL32987.1 hypothetical protein AYO22_00072 [Fonsecaea multimorphosa]
MSQQRSPSVASDADDGGSDILDADAPFEDEDELGELDPDPVIQELNEAMQLIEQSETWRDFVTYLQQAFEIQTKARGRVNNAIMLGGAPVAQRSSAHPEHMRERSVWQFAFFYMVSRQLEHWSGAGDLQTSVSDPLYQAADKQVFDHFGVRVIQSTLPDLRDTFLYMPFLNLNVKHEQLRKMPGIVFTDDDEADPDPATTQWQQQLPVEEYFKASGLLAGFQKGETFLNHVVMV